MDKLIIRDRVQLCCECECEIVIHCWAETNGDVDLTLCVEFQDSVLVLNYVFSLVCEHNPNME